MSSKKLFDVGQRVRIAGPHNPKVFLWVSNPSGNVIPCVGYTDQTGYTNVDIHRDMLLDYDEDVDQGPVSDQQQYFEGKLTPDY